MLVTVHATIVIFNFETPSAEIAPETMRWIVPFMIASPNTLGLSVRVCRERRLPFLSLWQTSLTSSCSVILAQVNPAILTTLS